MQAWEEKYYEREAGREEGLKEGLKEGKEKGFMLARKALRLYGEGMSPEAIARECDLSEEQIRKLVE